MLNWSYTRTYVNMRAKSLELTIGSVQLNVANKPPYPISFTVEGASTEDESKIISLIQQSRLGTIKHTDIPNEYLTNTMKLLAYLGHNDTFDTILHHNHMFQLLAFAQWAKEYSLVEYATCCCISLTYAHCMFTLRRYRGKYFTSFTTDSSASEAVLAAGWEYTKRIHAFIVQPTIDHNLAPRTAAYIAAFTDNVEMLAKLPFQHVKAAKKYAEDGNSTRALAYIENLKKDTFTIVTESPSAFTGFIPKASDDAFEVSTAIKEAHPFGVSADVAPVLENTSGPTFTFAGSTPVPELGGAFVYSPVPPNIVFKTAHANESEPSLKKTKV